LIVSGPRVLRVSLAGKVHVALEMNADVLLPSPDGRHLAIGATNGSSNIWTLQRR
jgi:hypothetical protein